MEKNGVEQNGMEYNGTEQNGMEQRGGLNCVQCVKWLHVCVCLCVIIIIIIKFFCVGIIHS